MKQKLLILLLFAFATVTVSAQSNLKFADATSVEDLVGWYYWYIKSTTTAPTSDDDIETLYSSGTSKNRRVCFVKENDSQIKIYGMFEMPVLANVIFNAETGKISYIDIPCVVDNAYQAIGYDKTNNRSWQYLHMQSWSANSSAYVNYGSIRMYAHSAGRIYISNNWITPRYYDYTDKVYKFTGEWYIPGLNRNYMVAAQNVSGTSYADWNAVMYTTYGTKNIHNYTYETKCVNVTQEGNKLHVEGFLGYTGTIDVDLHPDNKLSIEQQTVLSTYTLYPASDATADKENIIEGEGTESKLEWGNYCRLNSSDQGVYWTSSEIVLFNPTATQFNFPVALTISDAGIASFSSQKAVDFSQAVKLGDEPETVALTPNAVTEFTAQKATLEPITTPIPANNGVFVTGDAGDYEIPTLKEADELTVDNKLQATSSETATGDGSTIYALGLKNGKAGVMLVTSGTEIAANKAYLVSDFGEAKEFISFDGETTGINGVENLETGNSAVYNLQGQRVGENYRGVVVKNGKKYIKL